MCSRKISPGRIQIERANIGKGACNLRVYCNLVTEIDVRSLIAPSFTDIRRIKCNPECMKCTLKIKWQNANCQSFSKIVTLFFHWNGLFIHNVLIEEGIALYIA